MKAKFLIGSIDIEVEGNVNEISEIIALQQQKQSIKIKPVNISQGESDLKKQKRGPMPRWTKEEDARLINGYETQKSIVELAKMLHRTEKAITKRLVVFRNSGKIE